jgi:hypothetical protein
MNLDQFLVLRPFAYHVTRAANLERLASTFKLFPAAELIRRSGESHLMRIRRTKPRTVVVDGKAFVLQDQQPLICANAELHNGWAEGDFVEFLNHHVFFWPGLASGPIKHGARLFEHYRADRPAVLRFNTRRLLQSNPDLVPLFCAFNSGAPRMQYGHRVPRGPDLFVSSGEFPRSPGKVVELVFRGVVTLPVDGQFHSSDGNWMPLKSPI